MANKNKFRVRAFISFSLLLTFCVISISGIILYLRPEGSIAKWVGWSLGGVDKKGWEALHTLFTFVFIPLVLVHLYFNWKVLINYLKARYNEGLKRRKEFTLAFSLTLILLVGIILRWPALWWVSDLRTHFKKGELWLETPPPKPEFHKYNLLEVATEFNIQVEQVVKILEANKMNIQSHEQSLHTTAKENHTTPENIYRILTAGVVK